MIDIEEHYENKMIDGNEVVEEYYENGCKTKIHKNGVITKTWYKNGQIDRLEIKCPDGCHVEQKVVFLNQDGQEEECEILPISKSEKLFAKRQK